MPDFGSGVRRPVIFIAYYYPPDVQSGAARPHRLAKYLQRLGHPVEVCAAAWVSGVEAQGNVHRLRSGSVRHINKGAAALVERAFRQTLFVHDPGGTWAWRVAAYARRWMNSPVPPVVISTGPPATTHWAAYLIRRRYGVRWIADFRDPMRGNPFRPGRMAELADGWLEPLIFRNADALIANTDTVRALWQQQYPAYANRMHVLWNGFDPEEDLPQLPLPERSWRELSHTGVIYGDRDPHLVLRSFARLVDSKRLTSERYRIRFVGTRTGDLANPDLVQHLLSLGCLQIEDAVPRADAQRIMSTSDYLLLLDVISGKAGLQVPAKLFEYIRTGRPILASTKRDSPVDRILKASGVSYTGLYNDGNEEATDAALLDFLTRPATLAKPSQWFQDNFDAHRQADQLSALING